MQLVSKRTHPSAAPGRAVVRVAHVSSYTNNAMQIHQKPVLLVARSNLPFETE